jgi:hypothetical protein
MVIAEAGRIAWWSLVASANFFLSNAVPWQKSLGPDCSPQEKHRRRSTFNLQTFDKKEYRIGTVRAVSVSNIQARINRSDSNQCTRALIDFDATQNTR